MPSIQIESELCSTNREINMNLDWNQLCEKLSQLSGVLPADMELRFEFRDKTTKTVTAPCEKTGPFGEFLKQTPVLLHITDVNSGSLAHELAQDMARSENNSDPLSKHFTLSEEDYKKRDDSVLQWKKNTGLGSYDPQYRAKLDQELQRQKEWAQRLTLNERCRVTTPNSGLERRGWLRYVGHLPHTRSKDQGIWCGVEFDEPCGKNDGSLDGEVLFGPVKPSYGGFVKPTSVETSSEFQPLDIDLNSDDDDDEEL
ncbi:LAFA_0E08922g1_1 [Lachancea sp. 'fantastica']|nr:LAFA_0E08922g1_1 [Lachancea sp. 'fantastica']